MNDLEDVFLKIKSILVKYSSSFLSKDKYIGSQAIEKKPAYHLYGSKKVSLFGKKSQPTYIAGVIQQKNYVSFYLSAIYSHPELFKNISPELKKFLKGKSCFNINKLTPPILQEVEEILQIGIKKYQELDWV
ncbi:MAG: hypothetical protein ACFFEY_03565 [Candidatus Thorarchaeota archaeon]